jgi:hypothetical protein
MDTLNIIIMSAAGFGILALAWIGGYELGQAAGTDAERQLANRRVNGLLNELNKYKPRARRKRRAAK